MLIKIFFCFSYLSQVIFMITAIYYCFEIFTFSAWCFLGNNGGSSWGISSLFGGDDSRMTVKENIASKPHTEQPVHSKEQSFSTIHLREVYICDMYIISFIMFLRYKFHIVLWFL